jgi:hypothetical protein
MKKDQLPEFKPVTKEFVRKMFKLAEKDLEYIRKIKEDEERSKLFFEEYGDKLIVGGPVDEWIKAHEEFERRHPRKI